MYKRNNPKQSKTETKTKQKENKKKKETKRKRNYIELMVSGPCNVSNAMLCDDITRRAGA